MGTDLQSHDRCVNNHNAEPTNQPVSKGYDLTIHQSIEENYCVGKSSKILFKVQKPYGIICLVSLSSFWILFV